MWDISGKHYKYTKGGKEVILIYKNGDYWEGNVLGYGQVTKNKSSFKVLAKCMQIAEECGWF